MAEKILKTKIALLYKTYDEWDAIQDEYTPLRGEVCICDVPTSSEEQHAVLLKVGNGEDVFRDLPWTSALASDVFGWAKKENLEFSDLSEEFKTNIKEYIETQTGGTMYRIIADGDNKWKLQKSSDGKVWVDAEGVIDVNEALNKKVDREVKSGTTTSLIFNESDGGGAQITTATNKGFAGVHDGTNPDKTYATMYVKNADGSKTLVRLDLNADGTAHYLKNGERASEDNELATTGDITEAVKDLEGALHFLGVTERQKDSEGQYIETVEEAIERLLEEKKHEPKAGDVVIVDTAEYVFDGENWKVIGDEGSYATKSELKAEEERAKAKEDELVAKDAELEAKDTELENQITELKEELFVPAEPELVNGILYANGVALRIVDDGTQNVAHYNTAHNEDHTIEFPYNTSVYGGGLGTAEIAANHESTSIVIDGGKLKSVFGGSHYFGNVGVANIVMHKGTVSSGLMGGANGTGNANASVGEANITVYDGDIMMVYGGPASNTTVGKSNVNIHGGNIKYVTVGGSNGETLTGKTVIDGGNIELVQTVNRGYIEDAKVIVNGGVIDKMYAGGETEDSSVTGKAEKVFLDILDGEVKNLYKGSYAGVEDATRCSGNYNAWAVNKSQAEACNLVENELILNCNL